MGSPQPPAPTPQPRLAIPGTLAQEALATTGSCNRVKGMALLQPWCWQGLCCGSRELGFRGGWEAGYPLAWPCGDQQFIEIGRVPFAEFTVG